jgi:hypothetical protein
VPLCLGPDTNADAAASGAAAADTEIGKAATPAA